MEDAIMAFDVLESSLKTLEEDKADAEVGCMEGKTGSLERTLAVDVMLSSASFWEPLSAPCRAFLRTECRSLLKVAKTRSIVR
jgi:hypothetical protein